MQRQSQGFAAEVAVSKAFSPEITMPLVSSADPVEGHYRRVSSGAGLAHDAGNLIGALGLYCDLMSRPGVVSPDFQHYLTELRHLAVRGESLIERLLKLDWERFGLPASRKEASCNAPGLALPSSDASAECDGAVVNPAVVLERLQGMLGHIAGPLIRLELDCNCRDALLPVDAESLERILVNLTRNAARAMPDGGVLRFFWGTAGRGESNRSRKEMLAGQPQSLLLCVEDTGCGMSPETAGELASNGKRAAGSLYDSASAAGHGLGLRIVRELVEASGGQLHIYSRKGEGTRVEIEWPLILLEPQAISRYGSKKVEASTFHSIVEEAFGANITISSQGPVGAETLQTGGQISIGFDQKIATGNGDSAIC